MVEHDLAKVGVAGSSPVFRSKKSEAELFRLFCLIHPYPVLEKMSFFVNRGEGKGKRVCRQWIETRNARMAELVDALDLKSSGHFVLGGSSPPPGTIINRYF